jgi:hypothetical protein
MVCIDYSCHFLDGKFSPELVHEKTGLRFDKAEEAGQIGKLGKYRNKPQPYGAAVIRVPDNVSYEKKIAWLAKQVQPNLPMIRRCGATRIYVDEAIYHDGQCNLAFESEELKLLSDFGLPFCVSVYEGKEISIERS